MREPDPPVAIVGLSCRFPGAPNRDALWTALTNGTDAVTEVPEERWARRTYVDDKGRVQRQYGGFLDNVDRFDPAFFSISAREAVRMDPQQRLLLEVAWEALEDAGQPADSLTGSRTGVFVGISLEDYCRHQMAHLDALDAYVVTGSAFSIAANRISYALGLQGPSMAVDTACSSSLVALHLACASLHKNESSLAVVGGVNLMLLPGFHLGLGKLGALASDGRCKSFDARADGYTRGEGAAAVVLKRLDDAQRDGDPIWAVVRGSAVNQDGRSNGLTAPNRFAQVAVLEEAYAAAGIAPADVRYIEAHGTGTLLGDPIEVSALGEVLARGRAPGSRCALGSIKTNIGHLEAGAGLAGLIKVALCLRHRELVPSLHFETPNPHIPFADLPLAVQTRRGPWPDGPGPLVAGVSSFGFGGTNAHVVVTEAPFAAAPTRTATGRDIILPLSARSKGALLELKEKTAEALTSGSLSNTSLEDLAFTAGVRRSHFEHRSAVVGNSADKLAAALRASAGQARRAARAPRVCLVFSGQGRQWWGMAAGLMKASPPFLAALMEVDAALRHHVPWSLMAELSRGESESRVADTEIAQPALFAIQRALAAWLKAHGVQPAVVMGHSVGEIAAAHEAGVLSLADAARIAAHRGRIMQRAVGKGAMAAVAVSLDEAQELIANKRDLIAVAAHNAPESTVLSGDPVALEQLTAALALRNIRVAPLPGRYAFHSPQMDELQPPLEDALAGIAPSAPKVTLVSTLTGARFGPGDYGTRYWSRQMRDRVRFADAIGAALEEGASLFIEVAPTPVLGGAIAQCLRARQSDASAHGTLQRGVDDQVAMLNALAQLYERGVKVDFAALQPTGSVVALPQTPFQRERYWWEPDDQRPALRAERSTDHALLGRRQVLAEPARSHLFESAIDLVAAPFVDDHRVQGAVVVPGTAFAELARAAAVEVFGLGPIALTDVTFKAGLFLKAGAGRHLQLTLTTTGPGNGLFHIHSRAADSPVSGPFTLHASGAAARMTEEGAPLDLDAIRKRMVDEVPAASFYEALGAAGNQYGPRHQGIARLWRCAADGDKGRTEAFATVEVGPALAGELAGYGFHPALLDACGQVLLAATGREPAAFMPVGVDAARFFRAPSSRLVCHARRRETRPGEDVVGDVFIAQEDGALVAVLEGARIRFLDDVRTDERDEDPAKWLYTVRWHEAPRGSPESAGDVSLANKARPWIILGDEGGLGEALALSLRADGRAAVVVQRGVVFAPPRDGRAAMRPGSVEDATAIVEHLGAAGPAGVVHLWSLDGRPIEGVAELARALKGAGTGRGDRFLLVTRGAQRAVAADVDIAVRAASLWGFGRTLVQEQPTLRWGLIDVDPRASIDAQARGLLDEVRTGRGGDEVALRGDARFAPRLERVTSLPPAATIGSRLRRDGTYLITGGLGDLGLTLARYLVARGARRLVLLGRTPLPPRRTWVVAFDDPATAARIAAVRALEAEGASILTAKVDVGDPAALGAFFEEFRAEGWPPLRGVFHLAGVVELTPALDTTAERWAGIQAPKADAAWRLHELTASDPLDLFVLFSSFSALLGSPRLGAYAGANASLDALAEHRRARGQPALSLGWGFWEETGMMARRSRAGLSMPKGMRAIPTDAGIDLLGRLVASDGGGLAHVGIIPVDWRRFHEAHSLAGVALLEGLVETSTSAPEQSAALSTSALDAILAAPMEERGDRIAAHVRAEVALVLKIKAEGIDVLDPLVNMGLDSLMATELKGRLEGQLKIALPMVTFLEGPSVRGVSREIMARLAAGATRSPAAPTTRRRDGMISPNQDVVWTFHEQFPGSYITARGMRIRGALNRDFLHRAFELFVKRHVLFRTAFVVKDGVRGLEVRDSVSLDMPVVDASAFSEAQLADELAKEGTRPFPVDAPPLMRVVLYRIDANHHVMLIAIDHLICDALTFAILGQELRAVYKALEKGEEAKLPPVQFDYFDRTHWEHEMLASPDGENLWRYWQGQLAGPLELLGHKIDQPRDAPREHLITSQPMRVDAALTEQLKGLARQNGATVNMVALAAYAVMLHHASGAQRIVVGSNFAARVRREEAMLVGPLFNLIALRADFDGDPPFLTFLGEIRKMFLAALSNQDFPFGTLLPRICPDREKWRELPMIQAQFNFYNFDFLGERLDFDAGLTAFVLGQAGASLSMGSLTMEPVGIPRRVAYFDLALWAGLIGDELSAKLEHNPVLLSPARAERMARAIEKVLRAVAEDPSRRISTCLPPDALELAK